MCVQMTGGVSQIDHKSLAVKSVIVLVLITVQAAKMNLAHVVDTRNCGILFRRLKRRMKFLIKRIDLQNHHIIQNF